jgi:acetolactate synthase-1/2/3 large subunit
MNVSDYIVQFLCEKGIVDFFGYQGAMIAFFVDAIHRNPHVHNHSCYHEQGAAFAACGYAQATRSCGMAYATSGPGAANLLSGVANAYFDSEAVIFLTGQLNTNEYAGIEGLRQQGIQQIDIVSMAKPITKWAVQLDNAEDVRKIMEEAWFLANTGRKGPVLIDVPMNIQRTEINPEKLGAFNNLENVVPDNYKTCITYIMKELETSKRPLVLIGNGISETGRNKLRKIIEQMQLPVVTSMLAKSFLPAQHPLNFGYLGGTGMRIANLLACAKADLLLCLGISICPRHTGAKVNDFAPKANIIRIDIDPYQLKRKISDNEHNFCLDTNGIIDKLNQDYQTYKPKRDWLNVCNECRISLVNIDDENPGRFPNEQIKYFSQYTLENSVVVSDVGQCMMWAAQSFELKNGQELLFSGGHGAMGFALPAAIGAYYTNYKPVYSISGDGAFQMNLQELEWVAREQLPIKMLIMNNETLGLIRSFQENNCNSRFEGTVRNFNYQPVSFAKIAKAYDITCLETDDLRTITSLEDYLSSPEPLIIELHLPENTEVIPKSYMVEPIYKQKPHINYDLFNYLSSL